MLGKPFSLLFCSFRRRIDSRLPSTSKTAGKALIEMFCLAVAAAVTMTVVLPIGLTRKSAVTKSADSITGERKKNIILF